MKILNDFYPLPNQGGTLPATSSSLNYLNNEGRRSDSDQYNGRVDFQESPKSNWFFRYTQASDPQYLPSQTSIATGLGNNVVVDAKQPVLANTRLLGSNKVNEFRFAVNRFVSQNIQTRANSNNIVGGLGIPGVDTSIPLFWGIPFFQISGFDSIGECNDCPFVNWNTSFNNGWILVDQGETSNQVRWRLPPPALQRDRRSGSTGTVYLEWPIQQQRNG